MHRVTWRDKRWWLVVPPLVGMAVTVLVTDKGLYVSPDSVSYVGTARRLLDGQGWSPPPGLPRLGHFPPLFTLVLAGVGRLGLDPLEAARVVNMVAFGALIALVGAVLWRRTGSVGAGVVGSVLVLSAVDLLTFSAAALSEPLFVVLAVAAIVALAEYLDHRRPGLLGLAVVLAAAAVLTRYLGVALVLAGAAVLVGLGAKRRWHGAGDAAVFTVMATAPVLAWAIWAARAREGTAEDRTIAVHLPDLDYLGQSVRPLARWVVPFVAPGLGLGLAALVVLVGLAVLRRPSPGSETSSASALPWLLGTFAVAYLAVLVADRALLDVSGRLDSRFLAPLHVVAVLLVVPLVHGALRRRAGQADSRRFARVPAAAMAGVAGLVALQVADAAVWTADGVGDVGIARRGYTAEAWRRSDVVAAVAATEAGRPVYTNGFDAVFLLTGRHTLPLPVEKNYLTGEDNPRYAEELAAVQRSGGLVAYFDALTARQSFLASQAELERALSLQPMASDDVGTLYRLEPQPPRSSSATPNARSSD
ncbi:MAG: hypothetical protein H0T70_10150 [Acidimicrobiia bacterium]|nr:hypothetical protein [Acidimicrobiia bacterium]